MSADPQTDTLLITCASGKQASNLLPLLRDWKHLRLAVNSIPSQKRLEKSHPDASVIQADLYSPATCTNLVRGVTTVIYTPPTFHPHEASIGKMMIDAAVEEHKNGTLKHFIFSSVLNPTLSKMLNHYHKRDVEEYLTESGLPFTILQPSHFMDNHHLPVIGSVEQPVVGVPFDLDTKFSFTALKDLAEVMKKVLQEREHHFYALYPLVSTHTLLSMREVVGIFEEKLKCDIRIEKIGLEHAVNAIVGDAKKDQRRRDAAERMLLFYDSRGLLGNSSVMEMLLNRQATQFGDWVDLEIEEMKKRRVE